VSEADAAAFAAPAFEKGGIPDAAPPPVYCQ
jgi:hypothetical protein